MLSARAEALRLARSDEEIVVPPDPDVLRDSPEAAVFWDEIKPKYYASLAQTMDLVLGHMLEKRPDRPPDGLLGSTREAWNWNRRHDRPWQAVVEDMQETFRQANYELRGTRLYGQAARFTYAVVLCAEHRYDELSELLEGGLNTGIGSVLVLLRNLPNIAQHHGLDSTNEELGDIARHPETTRVLRPLAKTSMERMRAAEVALTGRWLHWHEVGTVLDPEQYHFKRHNDGSLSLAYADFSALEVPAGHVTNSHTVMARHIDKTTLVSDIESSRGRVVGCPITLLQGRLGELLHWGVDLVERHDLWNETWPNPNAA